MQEIHQERGSSGSTDNGATLQEAREADVVTTLPALSCEWLLSTELASEAKHNPEIQEQLRQIGPISLAEEGRIVSCIFNSDQVVLDLFEAFAHLSIFRFVAYSQAYVGRGLESTD